MSDVRGPISSITFCIVGGKSLSFVLAAPAGTTITFASSDPYSVPAPDTVTVPTGQNFIQILTSTNSVSASAFVTLTATADSESQTLTVYLLAASQAFVPI